MTLDVVVGEKPNRSKSPEWKKDGKSHYEGVGGIAPEPPWAAKIAIPMSTPAHGGSAGLLSCATLGPIVRAQNWPDLKLAQLLNHPGTDKQRDPSSAVSEAKAVREGEGKRKDGGNG